MAARLALLLVLRCSSAWHATPRGRYALPRRATSDDLAELRVPDLKDQCRALGLPVSGTKAVLIERILEADGAPAATADAADAAAASIDDAGVEHPSELEATGTLVASASADQTAMVFDVTEGAGMTVVTVLSTLEDTQIARNIPDAARGLRALKAYRDALTQERLATGSVKQ